ncbi:class I SAM-dependent methyltransferase [Rhodococcus sp. 077-4]|uniref:class I SAM-dependent methyltransferase n=1 Tax=Rhodococcus sp. 077-4 TaxID=2789271 RepID=UPI0039F4F11C
MTTTAPTADATATRVALWRALHRETDEPPLVFDDHVALELANPEPTWRNRGDMGPATARARASIVARARLAEDIVEAKSRDGIEQYVVLGAGLDTFAQRRTDLTKTLTVFEVDRPDTQRWKRSRLAELGLDSTEQTFVPVDFDHGENWWTKLEESGFDPRRGAVFVSLGVSMYLTAQANSKTFEYIGSGSNSAFVVSFQVPSDMVEPSERHTHQSVKRGAQQGGSPWQSAYRPEDLVALATKCGFGSVEHVSPEDLRQTYFCSRPDSLMPSSIEHLLIADESGRRDGSAS